MNTPKVVSIGPYHHGRMELESMEEYKMRYLHDFIEMTNRPLWSCIEVVRGKEEELRAYYAETISFTSDDFVKIILTDASFIIVFLLRLNLRELRDEADHTFRSALISQDGWSDLLLLENQLPFFILLDLFNFGIQEWPDNEGKVDIFRLLFNFFKWLMHLEVQKGTLEVIRSSKIQHFVDFLIRLQCPCISQCTRELQTTTSLKIDLSLLSRMEAGVEAITVTIPTITELHKAGVRLKVGETTNLFDIQFKNGVLKFPKLIIGKASGISAHNMLLFEKCCLTSNYIHDSIQLMDILIRTQKDVDLLVDYGILEHRLDRSKVLPLIQELADETFSDRKGWYFDGLCQNLNTYCGHPSRRWRARWYDWKENLIETYFKTPWSGISVIAAVVLLTLTVVQTVYAILSFHSSRSVGAGP